MMKENTYFWMSTKVTPLPRLFVYVGLTHDPNPCFAHAVREVETGEISEVEDGWFDQELTGRKIKEVIA